MQVGAGTSFHSFAGPGVAGTTFTQAESSARTTAATADIRVTGSIAWRTYAGAEAQWGGLLGGTNDLVPHRADYVVLGAVVGWTQPIGRWLQARGEALLGRRMIWSMVPMPGCDPQMGQSWGQWLAVPGAALEAWLLPWVTVGATASLDAMRDYGYTTGAFVTMHLRDFDGRPRAHAILR